MTGGGPAQAAGVTSSLPGGGALDTETVGHLPAGATTLRQVFPGADLGELTRRHLEALAWLAGRGIAALPASPMAHAVQIEAQLATADAAVMAHPLRHAARLLVLSVCRRHLDQGPVQAQRHAGVRVEAVLAGV